MRAPLKRCCALRLGTLLLRMCVITCGLEIACMLACAQRARVPAAQRHSHEQHRADTTIRIWGSPQMLDLLLRYETSFRRVRRDVHFVNELHSTVTAVAGVYTGSAEVGLLGREIWPVELQAYTSVKHHPPLLIEIATGSYDVPKATFALMIVVPQTNPIASLSTAQLARIFGSPTDGREAAIRTWGDVGLTGEWVDRPIHLYGFEVENDKSQIFSKLVFARGQRWSCGLREFNNTSSEDAGSAIVDAVARDPDAIGISNVHYATSSVRIVPIAIPGRESITPTRATVADQSYPLTRAVYAVIDPGGSRPAHTGRSTIVRDFLRFVLSSQGADAVRAEGSYLPLTDKVAGQQRTVLDSPGTLLPPRNLP